MVDLWDRRGSVVGTYSGGMKRRLEIARGLLQALRVLFLERHHRRAGPPDAVEHLGLHQ